MSLRVGTISQVSEDTARVAKAVFRKGNRYVLLREPSAISSQGNTSKTFFIPKDVQP